MKTKIPGMLACALSLVVCFSSGTRLESQSVANASVETTEKPKDEDVVQMDVFDVSAERDVGYMSSHVESASRLNVAIGDIPQHIVVFNQVFLQDVMAESIADVVLYDPTISATNEGDSFVMRGMGGAKTAGVGANYFNGFEQLGGFGSQTLVNTERIEILKGPNAVLYGQGAFGGTISRTSKKPQGKKATKLLSRIDQNGYFHTEVDHQAPIVRRKLSYRLNAMWGDGDDWRNYPMRKYAVSPAIRWDITPRDNLVVEYTRTYEKSKWANFEFLLHGNDPREITVNDIRYPVNTRRFLGENSDRRIHENNIVYGEFRHEFSKHFYFRAMYNSENKTSDHFETLIDAQYFAMVHEPGPDGKPDPSRPEQPYVSRVYRDWQQEYDAYRARVEFVVSDIKTLGINHKLIVGMGWEDLTTDDIRLQSLYNRTNRANPGSPFAAMLTDNLRLAPANILGHSPGEVPWVGGALQPLEISHYNNEGVPVIAQQVSGAYGSSLPRVFVNQCMSTRVVSYYVSDLMSLMDSRFFIQFGLRYVDSRRDEERRGTVYNRFSSSENDRRLLDKYDRTYREYPLTHSFGLVYHLTKNKAWTLYFNNNTSFMPNYSTEYPEGPKLKSQTGTQYEGGLKFFDVWHNRFHATLSYFDITQKNVPQSGVVYYMDSDGVPRERWGTMTIDGLHSQGFEVSFNATPVRGWQVIGGYAYTQCENLDPQVDPNTGLRYSSRHYWTPRHSVSMLNTYKFNSGPVRGLSLSLGVQWRDTMIAQYIPYTNEIRDEAPYMVPSYLNINAHAAYGFKIGKKIFAVARLKVSNVTNEYNALASYNIRVQWARPRNATLELELKF